jgi:hypothetical protein
MVARAPRQPLTRSRRRPPAQALPAAWTALLVPGPALARLADRLGELGREMAAAAAAAASSSPSPERGPGRAPTRTAQRAAGQLEVSH